MTSAIPGLPSSGNLWPTARLLESGLDSRSIRGMVQAQTLVRLRRGCYARASWWMALTPSEQRRQQIFAHAVGTLTTTTGGAAYSHTSAASLHGLSLWNVDDRVHVTQAGRPSSISHGCDVVAHTRALGSRDLCLVGGLVCTALERTVIDCCLMLNIRQSLILVDHACRLGADLARLRAQCAALAGRNGVVALRRAVALADPRSESAGESLTRELLHRLKLPAPELQYVLRTPLGEHRLDFAWPELKVALEFDGRAKYFDYRPTGDVVFAERRREKALMEQGWTIIRVEWKDLFSEVDFKVRILRALGRGSAGRLA